MPLRFSDEDFRAYLRNERIEYIVLTRLTESEVSSVVPKLLRNCQYLAIERVFEPTGRMYRLLSAPAPAAANACADLQRGIGGPPR